MSEINLIGLSMCIFYSMKKKRERVRECVRVSESE